MKGGVCTLPRSPLTSGVSILLLHPHRGNPEDTQHPSSKSPFLFHVNHVLQPRDDYHLESSELWILPFLEMKKLRLKDGI